MSFETQMTSVRNGAFQVETRKAGSGEPLVFLHGAGGNAQLDKGMEMLAEHYTVYAPSAPGWDGSEGIEQIDDIIDMAMFYSEYFDAMGLTSFNLVGASMGGMFAAEVAAIFPQYVKKLVLLAPTGLWSDEIKTPDFYTMGDDELMHALFVNPPTIPPPPENPDEATRQMMMQMMLSRARAMASSTKFLWPIWDKGLKKRIHRIKAPTLLIWGDSDGVNPPAYGPVWQKSIAGSKLVNVAKAAHVVSVEQPDEFVKLVTGFFG
jgi:pimeloyl-ACP methyl ester carboxylesterase